jgi:hypothetical protein
MLPGPRPRAGGREGPRPRAAFRQGHPRYRRKVAAKSLTELEQQPSFTCACVCIPLLASVIMAVFMNRGGYSDRIPMFN